MRTNRSSLVIGCCVVLLGLAMIVDHVRSPAPTTTTELDSLADSVAEQVDDAVDKAILGRTSKDAALDRQEPHIETALDVMSKPHYAEDVSRWAAQRQLREAQAIKPQPAKSIYELRREQAALRAQLHSMLKHRVRSTTNDVSHVLATQAKIAQENKAEIHHDLTTDAFNPTSVPRFHSAALDKPEHVVDSEAEVQQLESQLARKIQSGEELEQRNNAAAAVKKFHSTNGNNNNKVQSLADAPAAAPAAAAATTTTTADDNDEESGDADKTYAWDSPPNKPSVAYTATEEDGLPAAQAVLTNSRNRVTARLSAQLQNAKARLERFRSHWSVHMPDDLRRATNEGWSSQYSKDYMQQGKTRSDLQDEEQVIDALHRDMRKRYHDEEEAAYKLRDAKSRAEKYQAKVADLSQQVEKDQRDLAIAERNAEMLRKHLPEYYDDLSDDNSQEQAD